MNFNSPSPRSYCPLLSLLYNSDYISMKSWLVLLALLASTCSSFTNTTDFYARQLGIDPKDMHFQGYSGFQEIDWYRPKGQSGMYYQLFSALGCDIMKEDPRIPLIIWLQGGPGGSSQFGLFTENGPIRIVDGKAKLFSYSWSNQGHMIFIDQPLNVGFSYYGNRTGKAQVSSANEAAEHLLNFLSNFYREWPMLRSSPLIITGQSFAGHYIPAFARTILMNTSFTESNKMKLAGVAIGDGWTDPPNQFNYYDSLLYSVGIVSNKFRDTVRWFQTQGIINILHQDFQNATNYFDFLTNDDDMKAKYLGGMNNFNFRQYKDIDQTFVDFIKNNKDALGVPKDLDYLPGSDQVYESFHADISQSYASDVVIMLRHIRVLIYNGQDDFVVNTAGVLQYLNSLGWEGINAWKRAKKQKWTIYGEIRGWAKTSGNLWFVLVNKAGHLVPSDQPWSAANMLGHFISKDNNWQQ